MICRICKEYKRPDERMLKYSIRHYAHYRCWLDKYGMNSFDNLSRWQLNQFPFFDVKARSLLPILENAIANATR